MEPTSHDAWFREQVRQGLKEADDPNTQWISHEEMKADWAKQRAELVERIRLQAEARKAKP
jgi:hypothetical protein